MIWGNSPSSSMTAVSQPVSQLINIYAVADLKFQEIIWLLPIISLPFAVTVNLLFSSTSQPYPVRKNIHIDTSCSSSSTSSTTSFLDSLQRYILQYIMLYSWWSLLYWGASRICPKEITRINGIRYFKWYHPHIH